MGNRIMAIVLSSIAIAAGMIALAADAAAFYELRKLKRTLSQWQSR